MRALLSVYDKTGLPELGRGLADLGYELVASGGTARQLTAAGLAVSPVEAITNAPEMLGGRVKTLHPAIHGGILARRTPEHLGELEARGLGTIDVVVCNLYPFQDTVAKPGVTEAEAIEQIDIGGVTLLRAAAKNFESVAVVSDPSDYGAVLAGLADGSLDATARRRLALKAFRHTAEYDVAISGWLGEQVEPEAGVFPQRMTLQLDRASVLRYGENPHQQAALYQWAGDPPDIVQIQGEKSLSYNNLLDIQAAWAIPLEFDRPAVAIIKHTSPCGVAARDTLLEAFDDAFESDPVSAFGSIIATNRTVDAEFVKALNGRAGRMRKKLFVEALVAPGYTEEALAILARRKKNCRVMKGEAMDLPTLDLRTVPGGLLAQTPDTRWIDDMRVVTQRHPTDAEMASLRFGRIVAKHIKSNAIVFTQGTATVGSGIGQPNRLNSVRLAAEQAGEKAQGASLASDAFFPFADGIEAAAAAGVTAVIQPGGSIRDDEVIAAADRLGLAMIFTGQRNFRH